MSNKYAVLLLLIFALGYTQSHGQEKPKFSDVNDQLGPNSIKVVGIIKEVLSGEAFCGKNYTTSIKVQISEITYRGRAIKNAISLNQDVTFVFEAIVVDDLRKNKKTPMKGQNVLIFAKENLCSDLYQSVYMVLNLEER
ncbi:MAG: hypothetical protein ABJF04_13070 [Reichenbachiella sp.]|uniref:hypothetical protein n=1 Tax=Reichenbachiella sp. TaxID=2184521 RepID=UPI00326473AC